MHLPPLTQRWIELVMLQVDLAVRRARSEASSDAITTSLATAQRDLSHDTAAEPALIGRLAQRLGLSETEELVAWCLVANQLAPQVASRLEALSGGAEVSFGTLASVAYAADPARAFGELAADARLFRFGLVELADDPRSVAPAWARRTVRASDRLLALAMLASAASSDPVVAELVLSTAEVAPLDELAVSGAAEARAAMRAGRCLVIAAGMPGLGRRSLLAAAAREAGHAVLAIDARRLAKELPALRAQVRAIVRECLLVGQTPLLARIDGLTAEARDLIGRELAQLAGPVLATCGPQRPPLRWDRPTIAIELTAPTFEQRGRLWLAALGSGSPSDGVFLADRYPLAPAMIGHAAQAARARAGDRTIAPDDIYAGIRAVLDDRLGDYARRVTVTQTWDDLVLPADDVATITELLARVRERRRVYDQWGFGAKVGRGLGVAALFSGPPGTGKTMVAALIARELGLELYQVDVAKLVSKWIGETEQHLGELFDAAEAGHAILLFDEADALFGKRTDVKSSNDRYANLETNYLLQRLESFTGICLLTSNHESSIDPAFQRRLALHLRFALPDHEQRARLWRAMMPAAAPVAGDIDVDDLARRFAMSGGYIRNAALRAAFLAASEDVSISRRHLDQAARVEYEGMGKLAA